MRVDARLDREIAAVTKATSVKVKDLFAWRPKLEETAVDVDEGRVSRSPGKPLLASRLDTPRGAWFIIDGHHRAVEAILAGQPTIDVELNEFVPRIERAGGAYRSYVEGKVNVYDFVRRRASSGELRSKKTRIPTPASRPLR